MRHRKRRGKLGVPTAHRRAMLRNLVTNLLIYERIKTTVPKAKEARRFADRMITLGKSGTLAARRRALAFIQRKDIVYKLFAEIAPRFKERKGGYTRIIKIGRRTYTSDAAPMSYLELTERAG